MDNHGNRRQFERLTLTERAVVVDDSGRELGPVKQVSGGGMLVCECGSEVLGLLHEGARLRVTVVEPDLGTTNIMDVEIRYIHGKDVGMQFISLK